MTEQDIVNSIRWRSNGDTITGTVDFTNGKSYSIISAPDQTARAAKTFIKELMVQRVAETCAAEQTELVIVSKKKTK